MSKPFDAAVDMQFTPPPDDPGAALVALQGVAAAAGGGRVDPIPLVGVSLDASVGISLPGVAASAEHFGAGVSLDFRADRTGSLLGGFLELTPPDAYGPRSITLALTPPLPGGGRIEQAGPTRYRGAIGVDLGVIVVAGFASLDLGDPLSVAAVLSGTFRPPIQLSFGFTLVGIGGAVGVNRRLDPDALSAALSSGELGNMLFPSDPVGQADQILPALDRCFPVSAGDFFGGPMLKLGWGTPTLVSATLGMIVSTQGVTIIGQVKLSLPCEEAPFALFQITVFGMATAEGVWMNGTLFNSRLGPVTIDGDARFRLTIGPQGSMALSVGGFHPHYTPPPGMEGMKRLSAELSPLPFASLRLEGYAALTTDTAQLGGGVSLHADLAVAAVDGQASFDAIIYFAPFKFRADFHASLSVEVCGERVAGVSVSADFSGPGHWELNGSLSVEILWFDVDVDLHLDWGDPLPEITATDDPVELVVHQLGLRDNWSATGDARAERMVVMGDAIAGADVPVPPLGALRVVQMAAPLDHQFKRLGGRPLDAPVTITVTSEHPGEPVPAGFPRGLFDDVAGPDDLGPTSALMLQNAGVTVGEAGLKTGRTTEKVLDFEDALLGLHDDGESFERLGRLAVRVRPDEEFMQAVAAGAAAQRRDAAEQTLRLPTFSVAEVLRG